MKQNSILVRRLTQSVIRRDHDRIATRSAGSIFAGKEEVKQYTWDERAKRFFYFMNMYVESSVYFT